MRIKLLPAFIVSLLLLTQCDLFRVPEQQVVLPSPRSWSEILASDTLRTITIETCYTAFEYRGKWYGYEYEKACQLADSLGLKLDLKFVYSEKEMADSLFTGYADLAIWPASMTVFDTLHYLLPTGPRWEAEQVLASARRLKPIAPDDSAHHYKISLTKGSRQWICFHDDSVRANYNLTTYVIDTIAADSLTSDQLTDELMEGLTDVVMLRTNVAQLMKDYYPTLKLTDPLPFSADSVAWLIAYGADTLQHKIDSLTATWTMMPHYDASLKRLYEQKLGRHARKVSYKLQDGALSRYDDIFKKYAREIDWDWRLLAAIAYIESKLDHTQISSRGPLGLMQLMPATVKALGYTEEDVIDPDTNVKVASSLIGKLLLTLRNKLTGVSEHDLIQFTLAGYNAGLGHVYDAIYLADTLGYDTHVWANNVEHCLRLKSDPDYYNFPKVKLGRFNGAFTINYISEVLATYDTFCAQVGPDDEKETLVKRNKK